MANFEIGVGKAGGLSGLSEYFFLFYFISVLGTCRVLFMTSRLAPAPSRPRSPAGCGSMSGTPLGANHGLVKDPGLWCGPLFRIISWSMSLAILTEYLRGRCSTLVVSSDPQYPCTSY